MKKSLVDAGLIGYQFGTVGVRCVILCLRLQTPSRVFASDGISMGTDGMRYSLQSRDLIADQVETAAGGHWLDGMVVIPGCDKNMPGVLMARTSPSCMHFNPTYNAYTYSREVEQTRSHDLWRHHSSGIV